MKSHPINTGKQKPFIPHKNLWSQHPGPAALHVDGNWRLLDLWALRNCFGQEDVCGDSVLGDFRIEDYRIERLKIKGLGIGKDTVRFSDYWIIGLLIGAPAL